MLSKLQPVANAILWCVAMLLSRLIFLRENVRTAMTVKAKLPKEDIETKARRQAAEKRAELGRIESQQKELSQETLSVIRRFGRLSAFSGQLSIARPAMNPRSTPRQRKSIAEQVSGVDWLTAFAAHNAL